MSGTFRNVPDLSEQAFIHISYVKNMLNKTLRNKIFFLFPDKQHALQFFISFF